jgi:NAD dependent epimerase/dehydratase
LAEDRVLVTGADGFIGSHLVEALVRRGDRVRAFVLYNSFNHRGWLDHLDAAILTELEIVPGDIRDAERVRDALRGCAVVHHLAALIPIPYSYLAPASYIDTNVTGTLNVLQAARSLGVRKLVQTSTSEVYGTARFVPITEDHPLHAQSPYAASKIAADQLALSFKASFGLPVAIIRPFNTFGPRQSIRAVIPTVIVQALSGAQRIRLGATHATRDFTFVEDTVAGFLAVADSDRAIGEVINIGSDCEIRVDAVVEAVGRAVGRTLKIERDPERERPPTSEVERLRADNRKARDLLGWRPAHGGEAGFARAIATTTAWFAEALAAGRYKADVYSF